MGFKQLILMHLQGLACQLVGAKDGGSSMEAAVSDVCSCHWVAIGSGVGEPMAWSTGRSMKGGLTHRVGKIARDM
jgi:hypothetical protein